MKKPDPRKHIMLKMRTEEHLSLNAIGEIYGITGERVRQVMGNTPWVHSLRKPWKCAGCGKKERRDSNDRKIKFCSPECRSKKNKFGIKRSDPRYNSVRSKQQWSDPKERKNRQKQMRRYYLKNKEKFARKAREYYLRNVERIKMLSVKNWRKRYWLKKIKNEKS